MTKKEINELKARVYSISNCMFPLDAFLNDIEQTKNQNYDKESAYNDLKLITDAVYELKEKLKEKEQNYTLEECKKMWEELGYELIRHERRELIFKSKEDGTIFTMWNFNNICYSKYWRGTPANITFQEHQLLTKTFKVLEKEEE